MLFGIMSLLRSFEYFLILLPSLYVIAGEGWERCSIEKKANPSQFNREKKMSLKPQPLGPIPEETYKLGQQLLAEDDVMRRIGEQYAEIVRDEDFAQMYSHTGQPGLSPARLALVSVLQAMEHISDRQAIAMVRTRIDWKYALHLPLN